MPFIDRETSKLIRQNLKKKYPKVKFSVRILHHTELMVTILKGPYSFGDYIQVNQFYIDEHYKDTPIERDFLKDVLQIMNDVKPQKELTYDYDYGSIPNYYQSIHIGKWDTHYERINDDRRV